MSQSLKTTTTIDTLSSASFPTPSAEVGQTTSSAVVPVVRVSDLAGLDDTTRMSVSDNWSVKRQKVGADAMRNTALGDTRMQEAVVMLSLEWLLIPGKDWASEVRDLGIDTGAIKSKHSAAYAVASTFGLDPSTSDKAIAKQHGQYIDRLSLAVVGLADIIRALPDDQKANLTFSDQGIAETVRLLRNAGGINAVAAKQRKASKQTPDERDFTIAIDRKKAAEHLANSGRKAIIDRLGGNSSQAEISLGLKMTQGGKEQLVPFKINLDDDALSKALQELAPVDPLVDTLGELLQVGQMVREITTDIPKDNLEDPDDATTEKRLASRHFVLRPDGSILVSPILNKSSLAIIARTKTPILQDWPEQFCHFQTFGRRKAEVNITDPERRKLFSATVESPGETLGHARIVLKTAANKSDDDIERDVGFLIEPLRSKPGNYPLDVKENTFAPTFQGSVIPFLIDRVFANFPLRMKSAWDKTIVRLSRDYFVIDNGYRKTELGSDDATGGGSINVRTADMHALVTAMRAVTLSGNVEIAADPDGALRVRFGTKLADYVVYIPALVAGSVSNRYFSTIELA